jgi:hypothetical protein
MSEGMEASGRWGWFRWRMTRSVGMSNADANTAWRGRERARPRFWEPRAIPGDLAVCDISKAHTCRTCWDVFVPYIEPG